MKIILLAFAILFTACTTKIPAMKEYRIAPELSLQSSLKQSSCSEKSLKISEVFGNSFLKSTDMHYVIGEYKELTFNESAWSDSLAKLLTSEILATLRQTGIYHNVESYRSRSDAQYVLESSVNEFMQYFDKEAKESYVVVDMTMSLVDVKSSEVVTTKRFYKRLDVKEANAQAGVEALNSAFKDVLFEVVEWLKSSC